jgi:predicted acylesterase/phospholipase RssA
MEEASQKNIIKHIVISGGGPAGIQTIGALQQLEKNGFWNIENIESIYSTSIGGIIGILLALKFDWDTVNDYIIKRPWHETMHFKVSQVFDMFSKKGLYDISLMQMFFKPFFDVRDISQHITLAEFHTLTKIDLHFFCLEINSFKIEEISYKNHPEMELLTVAYMSATIPLLFSPICIYDKCFVDGGVILNYPLQYCVETVGKDKIHEILGFKNSYVSEEFKPISTESNILEFMMNIVTHLIAKTTIHDEIQIPHEVICETRLMGLSFIKETISSQEKREILLNNGIKYADNFLLLKV